MKINYLGISGGKDSTATLLWMKYHSGYDPESLRVAFCDTQNEHEFTYDYIRMLGEKVHPIVWLESEGFYNQAKRKGRFPSAKARFCTFDLKMIPTQRDILKLVGDGNEVLLHTGVRRAESEKRSHLPEREFDMFYGVDVFRPLIDWTTEQVFALLKQHGIPYNPLYDYGAKRVGCYPCIFSRKAEIRQIAKYFPGRIDFLREKEIEIDSTFYAPDKVPEHLRNKKCITNDGREVMGVTIDNVVEWSKTSHGGKQYEMDFGEEESLYCDSVLGTCE